MRRLSIILFFNLLLLAGSAQALQFTANAVMSTPGGVDVSTYLYYSSGRIRKEFYYYGEPVIQILDANRHVSLMCFSEQKICYENKSEEEINIGIENSMSSPCEANPALVCENMGIEELNNRKATRWKIKSQEGGKERVSSFWVDTELNIPIKQVLPNGTSIELKWLGDEQLNNRATTKWRQLIKLSNGEIEESFQWFDKELKISIRETFSNGNSQELRNIVVEKLADTLFTMPQGFENKSRMQSSVEFGARP